MLSNEMLDFLNNILHLFESDIHLDQEGFERLKEESLENLINFDSLKLIRLISHVENELGFRFEGDKFDLEYFKNLETLSKLYKLYGSVGVEA